MTIEEFKDEYRRRNPSADEADCALATMNALVRGMLECEPTATGKLTNKDVLKALGAGDDLAHSSIRFGLGRWTTEEEVDYVVDKLTNVVRRLREMSPLYEMVKEGVDLSKMQWVSH